MNSRIIITLACVALAFAAKAEYQPMASKALLEKRITEVNTNIETKLSKLRSDVTELIYARFNAETNAASIKSKNSQIALNLYFQSLRDINMASCTNVGEYVKSATDENLKGLYLAWDGKRSNGLTCATNTYADVAAWQYVQFSGNTTNVELYVTTGAGERYNLSSPWRSRERTYTCTTNANRTLVLQYTRFDDKSYDIIMGRE